MTQIRSQPNHSRPFQASVALEELARQQGIKPIGNVDEIAARWPADDDPELFLKFILEHRAERRAAAHQAEDGLE